MSKLVALIFRMIILFYQKLLSPLFPPSCRYTPTCSEYALQAIKKHGPWKGGKITLARIMSCHPWGGHGHHPLQ